MPEIFSNWRKAARSSGRSEAVQVMAVLAHDQVGMQGDFFAGGGQVVEGAHRHIDFVAEALHIHRDGRRILFDERSGDAADHGVPLLALG
jgi:hypothetical protein